MRNAQFGIGVLLMVHCIHSVYKNSGVDKKVKLFCFLHCVYHAMYAFHIYPKMPSYQVAAGKIAWA